MILGITGSIACGKSLVAELLRERGAARLSADQLAREVVAPGSSLLAELVTLFGEQILAVDGALDRDRLGRLVFADEAARLRLNALLHPAIAGLAEKRLAALAESGVPLVVYEAPLLFEAGAEGRVDRILVVQVEPQVQLRRLMERDGIDAGTARQRIATQMSQQEKLARADYVIDNSGSRDETQRQVERLWIQLVGQQSAPIKSSS